MNNIKVSNSVFDLGLTLKELAIYTYLLSIHSKYKKVSMAAIAACCGLKTAEAVSRNIAALKKKGLITTVISTVKTDGLCGSNIYMLKELPFDDGFFFFPRSLFKLGLSYKELAILLFQYKAYSPERGISWNSYNDMAKALRMKRSDVISAINLLVQKHLLRKRLFRSQSNRNVFTDNHYTVVWFNVGAIKRKIKAKKKRAHPRHIGKLPKNNLRIYYNTPSDGWCQYINNKLEEKNTEIIYMLDTLLETGGGMIRDFAALLSDLWKSEQSGL